jgi:hypothetical protein
MYTNITLKEWFTQGSSAQASRAIGYFVDMASMVLEILDETQIVTKTA